MLEQLMSSPIAWAIMSVITIAGFGFGIFSFVNGKERRALSYSNHSSILIRKKRSVISKLSITYDEKAIDNLCVSKLTIWNSGNRTLSATDIVDTRELTIGVKNDNEILDAEIVLRSEETNNFSLKRINNHTFKVPFDYVEKKDGIVVQLMHTGTADDLTVDCKIKGGAALKNCSTTRVPKAITRFVNHVISQKVVAVLGLLSLMMLLVFAVLFVLGVFCPDILSFLSQADDYRPHLMTQVESGIVALVVSGFFVLYLIFYRAFLREVFSIGIPKALRDVK